MKYVLMFFVKIYRKIPGPWRLNCRFHPTCSLYALEALEEYGALKGTYMSVKRILKCNPFGSRGYDPVIKRSLNCEK